VSTETRSSRSRDSAQKPSKANAPEKTHHLLFESIAACFRKAVAHGPKILVPGLREAGDGLFRGSPCDLHAGMDDISPGVHARPISRMIFEADPLGQYHPEGVVDPSHFVRGLATCDHVTHHGLHRLQYFNLQPASRFPRPSFLPANFSINVCKFIPSPPIRENFPSKLAAGPGRHTILKSKHNLPSCTPVFQYFEGSPEGHSGSIIYTL